jgi:hypothetical protein
MKRINDLIHNHRDRFDGEPLDDGHLERFLLRLDTEFGHKGTGQRMLSSRSHMPGWYAFAAAIVVMISMSMVMMLHFSPDRGMIAQSITDQGKSDAQITQLEQYYVSLAEEKISSIDEMAREKRISQSAANDAKGHIHVLLDLSRSLAKEYLRLNNDERVLKAIVQQYMMISSVFEVVKTQSDKNNSESINPESNEKI